jgi:hypothetical protein
VRWGALRVAFASSLIHDGSKAQTTMRVRRDAEPVRDERAIRWSPRSLDVDLELTQRVQSIERELHDGVMWHCVAPCGDAIVRLPGRDLRGRGYAEVLEMSVAPWSLPIRELRWGRAAGAQRSLVWIQWIGAKPLRIAVLDGALAEAADIADDSVRLADGMSVTLSDPIVLREDHLGRTLKPPGAIERKWRSRATLAAPDRPRDEGWAIHELITFAD